MQSSASLDVVIATGLLETRSDRRRDFKRENEVLQDLALRLAASDHRLLDRLVEAAVIVCDAGSAGLSLHAVDAGQPVLRWRAVAGEYSRYLGGTLPLFSPCGVCLERGRPELFDRPERAFPYFKDVRPEISEALVIPLRAGGRDLGTIWIASHGDGRQFTSADLSFMTTLANFTAAALTLIAQESSAREAARGERLERERAERANRLKDEFLSILSHELRTPLHAILSWAELLVEGLSPADALDAATTIHRNAQRQVKLVDDLLDASRHLAGGMQMDTGPLDMRELLAAVVDGLRPAFAAKRLMLRLEDSPGCTSIQGDGPRLQQAIANVVSNAVKFSVAAGTVAIALEPAANAVTIRVTDDGAGIAADFLPFVFERFRQGDSSTRRHDRGLGLGLAIARDIWDAHGGAIEASSAGPGRGATFVLTLPLASALASQVDAIAEEETPSLAKCRILVVDDEADARDALGMVLRNRDAVVQTAGSTAEALRRLASEPPDAVLTDIAMPGEDGYALLQRIRDHVDVRVRGVLVMAVTAYSSDRDRARMVAAGFDAHVAKPLPARDMVRSVAALLGRVR
jgi:signal transduction histidine kinase/CheY-like chemotaxis protein